MSKIFRNEPEKAESVGGRRKIFRLDHSDAQVSFRVKIIIKMMVVSVTNNLRLLIYLLDERSNYNGIGNDYLADMCPGFVGVTGRLPALSEHIRRSSYSSGDYRDCHLSLNA